MTTPTRDPTTPNMTDALERVVDAGQSLLFRRVELAFAETIHAMGGDRSMWVAIPFAILGWLLLLYGIRSGLGMHLPSFGVDIGLGLGHLVAAWVLSTSRSRGQSR